MPHAIEENDKLVVGFTEIYGEAWHRHPNCFHVDQEVPVQFAEECFDFTVEKRPALFMHNGQLTECPDQFHLVDANTGVVLSPQTVGNQYHVVQNSEWLGMIVGGVLTSHDLRIESCGTLHNRRQAFVNAVVMEHTVKGDVSPTRTRILFGNGYDQRSYSACANQVRVVCANTYRLASVQGAMNKTMRKFKHTMNAIDAIADYTIDLADLIGAVEIHNQALDRLAELQVSPAFVREHLAALFGYDKDAEEGRTKTIAKGKVEKITEIFETKEDLNAGGIRGTRYALFNAVTDWADHFATARGGSDSMSREMEGITGNRDQVKQDSFSMLLA
jgi:phage/plasmid-like protein (TIGR03299 family)